MASVVSARAVPVCGGRSIQTKNSSGKSLSSARSVGSSGSSRLALRKTVAPGVSSRRGGALSVKAVNADVKKGRSVGGDAEDEQLEVVVDGSSDPSLTIVSVRATNRPGILQLMKSTLEDLSLNVERTEVDMDGDLVSDTFYVTSDDGSRVDDPYDMANIERVIKVVLNAHYSKSSGHARPEDGTSNMADESRKKDLLYSLMDNYIKNDVLSVQNSIVNHVEYTLARSRYRFDDFEAYQVRRRNPSDSRLAIRVFAAARSSPTPASVLTFARAAPSSHRTPVSPPPFRE